MKPTSEKPRFTPDQLEDGTCPICSAPPDHTRAYAGSYHYGPCSRHDLLIQHPRPTPSALLDKYKTYFRDAHSVKEWKQGMLPVYREMLRLLKQHLHIPMENAHILDAGCGNGAFLELLETTGARPVGQDLSSHAELPDDRIYTEPIEKLSARTNNRFHAVTAIYVLEHIPLPGSFLRSCRRLLKDNGLLLIRIPRTRPLYHVERFLGLETNLLHAPWHLYDYSLSAMKTLLNGSGFSVAGTGGAQTASANRLEAFFSQTVRGLEVTSRLFTGTPLAGTSITVIARRA